MVVGVDARCPECGRTFRTCTPSRACARCRARDLLGKTPVGRDLTDRLELSLRAERAKKEIERVFDYEAADPEATVTALEQLRSHITDLLAEM